MIDVQTDAGRLRFDGGRWSAVDADELAQVQAKALQTHTPEPPGWVADTERWIVEETVRALGIPARLLTTPREALGKPDRIE